MFFAGNRSHAIPLFVSASVLPLNMLYFARHILRLRISAIFLPVHLTFIHITLNFLMLVTYMLIDQD